MNLYLVERTVEPDWDETIALVVAAETDTMAREMGQEYHKEIWTATLIGTARDGLVRGMVLKSYNAG